MRIASLLPSATEMLCAIGAGPDLVGITHGCDYPPAIRGLPRITSTTIPLGADSATIDRAVRELRVSGQPLYRLETDRLLDLQPDLLVTQGLCDVCAIPDDVARSAASALPGRVEVVSLAPRSLEDVFQDVVTLGSITGHRAGAAQLQRNLRGRVDAVARRTGMTRARPRVTLLEWIDPLFACGHWTPEMVWLAGGVEGHGVRGGRSRQLAWSEITAWQPEVLVVACCGFDVSRAAGELPLLERLPGFSDLPCVKQGRVFLVDGDAYFSRSGPRLVESLELLGHLLHPDLVPWIDVPFQRYPGT